MAEQQKKVQEQDINQLRKVRRDKLAELQNDGRNPFEITKYDVTCHAADIKDNYEDMEGKQVRLAGRVMQKRIMGKASFCNILDPYLYINDVLRKIIWIPHAIYATDT